MSAWAEVERMLGDRRTAKPTELFPRYAISKPAARRLATALGMRMPRINTKVFAARDPDGREWFLVNLAGSSFYLEDAEGSTPRSHWRKR